VLANLLSNAIKFSQSGGVVTVAVTPAQPAQGNATQLPALRVSVRDPAAREPVRHDSRQPLVT